MIPFDQSVALGCFFKEKCLVLIAMFFVASVFSVENALAEEYTYEFEIDGSKICDENYKIMAKSSEKTKFACVKEQSSEKLTLRGWGFYEFALQFENKELALNVDNPTKITLKQMHKNLPVFGTLNVSEIPNNSDHINDNLNGFFQAHIIVDKPYCIASYLFFGCFQTFEELDEFGADACMFGTCWYVYYNGVAMIEEHGCDIITEMNEVCRHGNFSRAFIGDWKYMAVSSEEVSNDAIHCMIMEDRKIATIHGCFSNTADQNDFSDTMCRYGDVCIYISSNGNPTYDSSDERGCILDVGTSKECLKEIPERMQMQKKWQFIKIPEDKTELPYPMIAYVNYYPFMEGMTPHDFEKLFTENK